jgi:peptidoglycan hydrolase CwlO-like protein
MMSYQAIRSFGSVAGLGLLLSLTGCDYWPPALQAQIEQMRSEMQTIATEKSQLQVQVNDLAKAKQDLQAQVDDLTRTSHDKSAMITSLQHQLDSVRSKALKGMSSPKATAKVAAKPTAKAAAKQPVKKKPAPKR